MWRRTWITAGALLLVLALVTTAAAQEPTADDVNRIAKKLYCPVCPNTPLDVCETQACEDWREQIRDMLAEGYDDQAIIDYFVAQYGVRVLASPPRRGFTALVWVLPFVGLLAGGWLLVGVFRRRGVTSASSTVWHEELPTVPPEYLARLEDDVRKG
ncbi:MAG TPA: hypothetical protein G4O02_08645 [Caldilineae bacterium]|nr:hypothetical protein [Caldilineae bacterium]